MPSLSDDSICRFSDKKVLYQPCRYRLIQHLSISYMVSTRARTTAISARVIRVRGESIPPEVPLMTP